MVPQIFAAALVVAGTGVCSPVAAQMASTLPYQNPDPEPPAPLLRPGANSFAESQARALLERDGYADVSPLVNDANGIWRGRARKDNRPVDVSIDYLGTIAAR